MEGIDAWGCGSCAVAPGVTQGCAGVTPQKHLAALETMRSCQIAVVNE